MELVYISDLKSEFCEFESRHPYHNKESSMTQKETIDRAYGSIPKEVPGNFDYFDWVPTWRGVKYYWYRFVRKFTR